VVFTLNSVKDIIFPQDINRLPNTSLREICTDIGVDSTGSSGDLTNKIWSNYARMPQEAFDKLKEQALVGNTSLAWFHLSTNESLVGTKDKIVAGMDFDPFSEVRIPNENEITSEPKIICGATLGNDTLYYLRFIHSTGTTTSYFANTQHVRSRQEITTVYIDEEKGIVEIRSNSTNARKVASSLAILIQQQIAFEQTDALAPYGHAVERFADALDGQLIDTVGRPEGSDTEFKEEEGESIVNVLSALDDYFNDKDINALESKLNHEELNEVLSSTPFTTLLLSGLETVGLGSIRELRGLPLYDYIEPYIQKQKGSILFDVVENGVVQEYSIKVGIKTKTVKFNTPATEKALDFVREKIATI
jgi:hypothetical protein